jgi:hypothetical protein
MRCVSWLAAAGLVMVTAGCVEQSGYPTTSGYSPGYGSSNYGYSGYSNNYASQPSYYRPAPSYSYYTPPPPPRPQVVTQTRYVPVPVSPPQRSYNRSMRDSDRDGVPDRYDRDRNGDGVPDKYQRSRW